MAPNNKPKKPTMLQRQRQLRAQQQQVRRASSNQLPPSGSSSGNSRQARAQRANTTRAQAANNQRVINRGIEGFIRRGNAQDKLDKAAQGTRGSGTRTAGAGGGLARRPSSAITPANRGTAKPPKPAALPPNQFRGWGNLNDPNSYPKDSGRPRGPSSEQRAADNSRSTSNRSSSSPGRGGAIEKAGPTIDVKANTPKVGGGSPAKPPVRTGQPGPNRAALPPSRPNSAPANGSGGAARAGARAAGTALGRAGGAIGFLGTAAVAADQARRVFNPKDNLLTSLQQLGRSVSKATGDTSASGGRPGYRQKGTPVNSSVATDGRYIPGKEQKPIAKPAAKPSTSTPSSRSTASTQSSTTTRPSSSSGTSSRSTASSQRSSSSQTPAPFKGTVDEGRQMWAEKYASDKYKGQAIQKEAKKLLEKLKVNKESQSAAVKAGWDGNKNY